MNRYIQLFIGGASAGIGQYLALMALGVVGTPLLLGSALTALTTIGGMFKTLPQKKWTDEQRAAKLGKDLTQ